MIIITSIARKARVTEGVSCAAQLTTGGAAAATRTGSGGKPYGAEEYPSDPNNADAYTGRALMHLKEARDYHDDIDDIEAESIGFSSLSDAISDFEKAIELDPEGIQGRIKRFNFEGDMAFLPNYIKANKRRGVLLVSTNIYQAKGLEEYDRVLKIAPKDVEALIGRGSVYMRLQQYDLALHDFNKAIELAPNNADAYAGRGIACTKEKQYDLAIADFERAVLLDKGYGLGEYNDAYATPSESYERNVIGFASSYIDAYVSRGSAFLKQREFNLAINDFTKAIEFQADEGDANHPELDVSSAYANRGIAYSRTGAYKQAIDDFTIAVGSSYTSSFNMFTEAYIARAIAYSWTGQYGRALEDFSHAAVYTNLSMDADAYFARGIAYYWEGDLYYNSAYNDFRKVMELAPDSSQATEAQQYRTKIEQSGKLR